MTAGLCDLLPLYAVEALEAGERSALEAHLPGCADCRSELLQLQDVSVELATVVVAQPPAGLKARLMGRIAEAPRRPGVVLDQHGIFLARSSELPWREILPGVEAKLLNLDRETRYTTSLVRIAAGGKYPQHRHKDVEELYILSGDLHIEGATAGPGDYCRAEPDSVHREAYTVNGCLFLAVASQHDEIVA